MRTEEDEAFDDLARKQGDWGGGFQTKRKMAADKLQEFCTCHETHPMECQGCRTNRLAQPAQEPMARVLQFMKELRPAIGPMATMGKSKTTQEWFDIVINEIERLQATQEKNT